MTLTLGDHAARTEPSRDAPLAARQPSAGRRALLLFAVAVAVRVAYTALFLRHYVPVQDAEHYLGIAQNLAAGHGFSHVYPQTHLHSTAFRPPLYPIVLAGLFWVFGPHVVVAQTLNIVLGSASVVVAERLATRLAGPRAGLVAAALLIVYPSLLANDVVPLSESLSLLLILTTAWLLIDHRYELAAVSAGLLVLARSSAQGVVAVLAFWVLVKVGWRKALTFAALAALTVTPWVVRNEVQLGTPMIVTSDGFNMAAIYSPQARQSDPRLRFVDPTADPRFARYRAAQSNEARWDHELLQLGFEGLAQDPTRLIRVVGRNLGQLLELHPGHNVPPERSDGRNLTVRHYTLPFFYVITALGVLGLVRHARRASSLILMGVYFGGMASLFVTAPRLRAPFDLVCCIGVGLLAAGAGGTDFTGRTGRTEPASHQTVIDLRELVPAAG